MKKHTDQLTPTKTKPSQGNAAKVQEIHARVVLVAVTR